MINKALNSLFKARGKNSTGSPVGEMTFWEHLEDLRKVIFRMVTTLLIVFIFCVALIQNRLMPFLKAPVEAMWNQQIQDTLPKDLTTEDWESAKEHAESLALLEGDQKRFFFHQLEDKKEAKAVTLLNVLQLYRAVQPYSIEEQKELITQAPGFSDEVKAITLSLYEKERLPNSKLTTQEDRQVMGTLKPADGFMTSIKVSFFSALAISFPLLLFFALRFILPGLHKNERKALIPAIFIGFALFLGGICFAYFQVIPKILSFFYTYTEDLNARNNWTLNDYISFVTQLTLIFGLAFELPVVVLTLVKIGLLNFKMMNSTRSYAIVAILVIAALITPTPDIPTLMFLAVPMYLLYEASIWIAYFIGQKQRKQEEAEEAEYQKRIKEFAANQEAQNADLNDTKENQPIIDYYDDTPLQFEMPEDEYLEFVDSHIDLFHDDDYDEFAEHTAADYELSEKQYADFLAKRAEYIEKNGRVARSGDTLDEAHGWDDYDYFEDDSEITDETNKENNASEMPSDEEDPDRNENKNS